MKKPWVVKAGGEVLGRGGPGLRRFLAGLARLSKGRPVVFVHGGGPQLNEELARHGRGPRFLEGRRVTSREAVKVVERVLSGEINKEIVGDLLSLGCPAIGISGRDAGLIRARRAPRLGYAGHPAGVRPRLLARLLEAGYLPVVSPVSAGPGGEAVNVNADEAACALAGALKAARLLFLTNVAGVLDGSGRVFRSLDGRSARELIRRGIIRGGMLPKVEASLAALKGGVEEVVIGDGRQGVLGSLNGTRIRS